MKTLALSLIAPLIVGPLTFTLMQSLKKASAWVDALSPISKRFAVSAIAVALTLASKLAGVDIPCQPDENCLPLLDQDAVKAIISAALAFGLHWLKNAPKR